MADSNLIEVSGVGVATSVIPFPSGQIETGEAGSNLYAMLASANARFGFNMTPHTLEMQFVPIERDEEVYHGASGQLPAIGTFLEMNIGEFYFNGRVVHSSYASSTAGTVVSVNLEDDRKTLGKVKIHTEDLGIDVPSGVVSVGRAYRILNGLNDENDDVVDSLIFEYNKIASHGATYTQIYDALQLAINEGDVDFTIDKIPTLSYISSNIGGSANSLRFKFNMTPLSQAITSVLQDSAYDWYWNMHKQSVSVVNKRITFDLEEADIIGLINQVTGYSDPSVGTQRLSFGQDIVSEPTSFRLLGGKQQGIINSALLSPIDGLDTTALDGNVVFTPAWGNISVGFYDAGGYYRTYTPSDKELQMAMASIEHWTYFKIYQVSQFGLPEDEGSIAAQDDTFESRFDPAETLSDLAGNNAENSIRYINNRRDENHNWVLDFYNRVSNHAQRHFGRSYVASNVIVNEASGVFMPVDAAWCNLENQIDGQSTGVSGSPGPFTEDYQISSTFGPISPFVTDDYKVSSHVVLPANTVYGSDGDQAPSSFADWTEDAPPFNPNGDGSHYVPCTVNVVGGKVKNPRSGDLYSFEDYPDGTLWVQLPIIAGTMQEDSVLANLATLIELSAKVDSQGLFDTSNPTKLISPYSSLTGVAIPVESRVRYGQKFPNTWSMGDPHYLTGELVEVDDSFVPWNFYPLGNDTSLEIMMNRAARKVQGRVVEHLYSRYADVSQVGLPELSFNNFANQDSNSNGLYGERSHGVTDLSLVLDPSQGYMTRYKIASYFGEMGREAPLGEKLRSEMNGILHPINFTTLNLTNPIPPPPTNAGFPGDSTPIFPPAAGDKKTAVKVTINSVDRVFTINYASNPSSYDGPERYRGITDTGAYEKPPTYSGSDDFKYGAICVDGFLSLGDKAMYHNDEFETSGGSIVYRYFTGGRPLGNANIVKVYQQNAGDSTKYDVVLEGVGVTPGASDEEKRALIGVPVLNDGATRVGVLTTLCTNDNSDQVVPGAASDGIYLYSSDAGGIPVQIESLSNPGTNGARAAVRKIKSDLTIDAAETAIENVVPFPYPYYAQIGDQGLLGESSDGAYVVYIGRMPLRNS